jgi:hypothetical protein
MLKERPRDIEIKEIFNYAPEIGAFFNCAGSLNSGMTIVEAYGKTYYHVCPSLSINSKDHPEILKNLKRTLNAGNIRLKGSRWHWGKDNAWQFVELASSFMPRRKNQIDTIRKYKSMPEKLLKGLWPWMAVESTPSEVSVECYKQLLQFPGVAAGTIEALARVSKKDRIQIAMQSTDLYLLTAFNQTFGGELKKCQEKGSKYKIKNSEIITKQDSWLLRFTKKDTVNLLVNLVPHMRLRQDEMNTVLARAGHV